MSDKLIQEQIKEINSKLDLILEETSIQRQNREAMNDLADDVAVIGKDAFKELVIHLDNAGIELDSEALTCLILKLIRNIRSFGMIMELIESFTDLTKDVTPIIKQIGLDGVQKFNEFEQKGYFEVLHQIGITLDRILSRYTLSDIQKMADNLVPVVDTLVIISDPKLLGKINIAVTALREINPEDIKEYSIFQMMRQLNKPEVRKSMGFIMAFLQNISKTENN
jgi:uncharacterized protein YjgD (DUF1641 family)